MRDQPRGAELIVAGGVNNDLKRTIGQVRDEDILAVVETEGLEDI